MRDVIVEVMELSKLHLKSLSKYLMDLSKILFASAIVGFFIPGFSGPVNLPTFILGSLFALAFLLAGLKILPQENL